MSVNAPKKKEEFTACEKPSFNEKFNNVYSKRIKLTSNYFPLTLNKLKVFQYSIKIEPEIANDNFTLRQLIYKNIHHKIKENNFSPFLSSGFVLYTCNKEASNELKITAEIKEIKYNITIEKTNNTIDLSLINDNSMENLCVKTFIETLIRKIIEANSNLIRFDKRTYFDYVNYKKLDEHSREKIFPGYSTAVVITERGLNLRVLDANKLISGKTALEKINELKYKYKNGSIKENIMEYFKGRSLLTTYGSMRVYRIGDVSFDKNILNTEFQVKDETGNFYQINLKNYYKKFYNVDIRDPQQPLFIEEQKTNRDGTKKNIIVYLIPELLYLTDIEIENKSLDNKRNMINKTKLRAEEKIQKINDFFKLLNNNKKKTKRIKGIEKVFPSSFDVKNQWGIDISNNMEIFGKVIHPPFIHFSNNNIIRIEEGREKFKINKIINPISLRKNSWICITSKNNYDIALKMCRKLVESSKNYGIEIEVPSIKEIDARYSKDFIDELTYLKLQDYKIIVFVLTKYIENFYNDIKNYVNLNLNKPCQCMRSINFSKNYSYYGNVLLQMQNKLGSELFYINLDDNLINKKGVIMGIETSKYNGGNTYILTCSYLNYHNMYFIVKENIDYDINNQTNNLHTGLFKLLKKCFEQLRLNNFDRPPKFIFVYRAGGNEKMIKKIEEEAKIFSNLLNSEKENSLIKTGKINLNFTVCNRKTSSKFFEKKSNSEIKNPPCGTVIDNSITSPNYYEFYLQPQYVNQGTANPVYFRVLYDDTHMPIELFEKLTYHLTYLYTNWTGPIPYPVSLKYAEKALSFINKNLNGDVPDNKLSTTHFYI